MRWAQRAKTPLSDIEGVTGGEEMAKTVPIAVNKKKMSNSERAARETAEARLRSGRSKLRAPAWLSKDAKKEFRRLGKMLMELDVVCDLHSDMLAVFANTVVAYREVTKVLEDEGRFTEYTNKFGATNIVSHPAAAQQKQLSDQLRMFGVEFGLTPSALAKLALPKDPPKEPSEFDKLFGNVVPMRRDAR